MFGSGSVTRYLSINGNASFVPMEVIPKCTQSHGNETRHLLPSHKPVFWGRAVLLVSLRKLSSAWSRTLARKPPLLLQKISAEVNDSLPKNSSSRESPKQIESAGVSGWIAKQHSATRVRPRMTAAAWLCRRHWAKVAVIATLRFDSVADCLRKYSSCRKR